MLHDDDDVSYPRLHYCDIPDTMAEVVTNGLASMAIDSADKKREEYLDWNEYFMAVSFLSAMRSKDPATQVFVILGNDLPFVLN